MTKYHNEEIVTSLPADHIFVFGGNMAGRHGKGAALTAVRYFGAKYQVSNGPAGQSYAIPTKDQYIRTLSLNSINENIKLFKFYVMAHPELTFYLTPIGCGLAGYQPKDIAPLFYTLKDLNVIFPVSFKPYLDPRIPNG